MVEESLPWLRRWVARRRNIARLGVEDVQDIVQDVCVEALSSRANYVARGAPAGRLWLRTIAQRRLADRVRFWSARMREVSRRVDVAHAEREPARGALPLDVLVRDELLARVAGAIAQLPDQQRDVLHQQLRHGRTTSEIARAHGRSENAVRLLRSRGMAALRATLNESCDTFERAARSK